MNAGQKNREKKVSKSAAEDKEKKASKSADSDEKELTESGWDETLQRMSLVSR